MFVFLLSEPRWKVEKEWQAKSEWNEYGQELTAWLTTWSLMGETKIISFDVN